MLFFYVYANSFQPELQKVTIDLQNVKILDVDKINKRAHLGVDFYLDNPTSVTSTVSTINYELYGNGKDLGEGHYTVEDIPMAGRPALFSGGNVTLTNTFELVDTSNISDVYDSIIKGESVAYEAKGQVTVESTLTLITKDFDLKLG